MSVNVKRNLISAGQRLWGRVSSRLLGLLDLVSYSGGQGVCPSQPELGLLRGCMSSLLLLWGGALWLSVIQSLCDGNTGILEADGQACTFSLCLWPPSFTCSALGIGFVHVQMGWLVCASAAFCQGEAKHGAGLEFVDDCSWAASQESGIITISVLQRRKLRCGEA